VLRRCSHQLRGRFKIGRRLRKRRGEPVAAARNGLDHGLIAVAKGFTHFADASGERLVCHHDVRPHRLDKLLFGHQTISIRDEAAQYLKALWAEGDLAVSASKAAANGIQRELPKSEHPGSTVLAAPGLGQ
jgi:hypothetical protein